MTWQEAIAHKLSKDSDSTLVFGRRQANSQPTCTGHEGMTTLRTLP